VRILIVAATETEIAPLLERMISLPTGDLSVDLYSRGSHEIDVLITGIGMVATAAWCSRALAQTPYDLALNLGVCGSFDSFIEPGTVVHVVKDRIAELGAEDGDAFRTIEELQLPGQAEFVNFDPPSNSGIEQLPSVTGITVNTVHGNERSIADTEYSRCRGKMSKCTCSGIKTHAINRKSCRALAAQIASASHRRARSFIRNGCR